MRGNVLGRLALAGIVGGLVLGLLTPSLAQEADGWLARGRPPASTHAVTQAGRPVRVLLYFDVGPRCRRTVVDVRVATPPAHGTVAVADDDARPFASGRSYFAPGDPRAFCANRLAPTKTVTYVPAAGFSGHDQLAVSFTEAGQTQTAAVDIDVRAVQPIILQVSAEQADCLWAAAPQDVRDAAIAAPEAGTVGYALKPLFLKERIAGLMAVCGLSPSNPQLGPAGAILALMGKAESAWAHARLASGGRPSEAALDNIWAAVAIGDRQQIARQFIGDQQDTSGANATIRTLVAAAQPASEDEADTVFAYIVGRALVDSLAASLTLDEPPS
jgi:hypothetical protein